MAVRLRRAAGKAFLTRSGCFDNLDFALAWHPGSKTGLIKKALANIRVIFDFTGKSAHAAAHPELGRSALDACELMNVGVNYLREHVKSDARMHYAYLNDGGDAPNIVPAAATLLYALRAPESTYVAELYDRVSDVAKGAALMTGTRVSCRTVSAYAELLSVPAMEALMMEAMQEAEKPEYADDDYEYAARFAADQASPSIDTTILPADQSINLGSTDVGDVSWIVPTVHLNIPTFAAGTALHSWQAVAQGKSSIAHKGMLYAAKIMALTALDFLQNPELANQARKELTETLNGETYPDPLPKDLKPEIW